MARNAEEQLKRYPAPQPVISPPAPYTDHEKKVLRIAFQPQATREPSVTRMSVVGVTTVDPSMTKELHKAMFREMLRSVDREDLISPEEDQEFYEELVSDRHALEAVKNDPQYAVYYYFHKRLIGPRLQDGSFFAKDRTIESVKQIVGPLHEDGSFVKWELLFKMPIEPVIEKVDVGDHPVTVLKPIGRAKRPTMRHARRAAYCP